MQILFPLMCCFIINDRVAHLSSEISAFPLESCPLSDFSETQINNNNDDDENCFQ